MARQASAGAGGPTSLSIEENWRVYLNGLRLGSLEAVRGLPIDVLMLMAAD